MPILGLLPDANGDVAFWTGDYTGVLNLSGSDADLAFIQGTGDGATSLFRFQRAPLLYEPVRAVQWVGMQARMKKTVLPAQMVSGLVRSSGVDFTGSVTTVSSATYSDFTFPDILLFNDPATGKQWTWDAALAAQVGLVDQTMDPTAHGLRCNTLRKLVMVDYDSTFPPVRGPV